MLLRSIILCALLALLPLTSWAGMTAGEVTVFKAYKLKAEQGDAEAQFDVGFCYFEGIGVEINKAEAVKWYRKAAEQGYADGQCWLGRSYKNGEGVTKDYVEAVKWNRKAAMQGHSGAQCSLGIAYAGARGVERNNVEAYAWFNLSADTNPAAFEGRTLLEKGLSPSLIKAGQDRSKELQELIEKKIRGA
jgi:TPR repeat protein